MPGFEAAFQAAFFFVAFLAVFFFAAFFDGFLDGLLGGFLLGRLLLGEIGADVFRRMPDGGDRSLQFGRRDLEFLRPVADFVGLAQRDQGAVGRLVLLFLDIGFHFPGGVADLLDGGFQLGRRDLQFLRPIGDFVGLRPVRSARHRHRRASSCYPPSHCSCRVEKSDTSDGGNLTRPPALRTDSCLWRIQAVRTHGWRWTSRTGRHVTNETGNDLLWL